ncbi:MAG: Gldg family protein [Limnothrix sp.]
MLKGNLPRYLIWFGVAAFIAGLVILVAVQSDVLIAYSLVCVGLLLILGGFATDAQTKVFLRQFWSRRSTQIGANGLLSAIAVIVTLLLLNFLAAQFPVRFDLTESQIYTLSPQTKATVRDLEEPLKIWLFQETDDDLSITPLLNDYRRLNPSKIQYKFVDPDVDIQQLRRFQVQNRGEIHLEYADKTQLVQTLSPGERLNEAQLTSSIIRITGDRQPHIYLLQGHGEPAIDNTQNGLVQMVKAIEEQGYRVSPLNLAQTPTLPEDASIIALIAPQTALLPGEIELLQTHLQQQKSLLILLDPNTDPQLNPLLEPWGISLDQRILIDGEDRSALLGFGNTTLIQTDYGNHPITEAFQGNISLYQFVRPILTDPKDNVTATAILKTDAAVWAESGLPSPDARFDPSTDQQGPLDFGVAIEATIETAPSETVRSIIIGNTTFVTNRGFSQYFNGDLLLNSINWLNQDQNIPLAIRPKEPQNRRLNLSGLQIALIAWLAPILIPLTGLIGAIIIIQRRR